MMIFLGSLQQLVTGNSEMKELTEVGGQILSVTSGSNIAHCSTM